jgi:RNA polymerase sigma-70 factor (ECF subfamily)
MKLYPHDIDLVEKLRTGDIKAFNLIYEKYSLKLYSFGLKYLKSTDEAEELVQSVFVKLWENYRELKTETSFKSYLFTIAYNDMCKIFRKRKYDRRFIDDVLNSDFQFSYSLDENIDQKSILTQVQKIIDLLPEKQRTIFIKSKLEGKSTREISEELGLSPGSIDNYISKSLKFIRLRIRNENLSIALFFTLFCMQNMNKYL